MRGVKKCLSNSQRRCSGGPELLALGNELCYRNMRPTRAYARDSDVPDMGALRWILDIV